jgi:hypothetical protein
MDTMINSQPAELPIHPYTRLRALGLLPSGRIVWPVLGGADDGDDDADGDGEGEEDGDESDDEGDDEEHDDADTKPQDKSTKDDGEKTVSRAELSRVITARDAAKKQLRDTRRELEDLKRTNETSEQTARREAAEAAQQAADAKYKPISARAALLEAGVKPGRVKGALKLLDMDEIEIDADGEVAGLESQVEALRQDWPELFTEPEGEQGKRPAERRPARGADGADRKPAPKKEMTASERQAAMLLGKL